MKRTRLLLVLAAFVLALLLVKYIYDASRAPSEWSLKTGEQRLRDVEDRRKLQLIADLQAKGLSLGDEVFIRIIKESSEFELWMRRPTGKAFELYKTWPIARWSGGLGPKLKEGDGQAPEGFYDVIAERMNPLSKYHLAFNVGYPNAFDSAHERTGSLIMVHGSNVSIGCYAMTDPVIEEIYLLVNEALKAGQTSVPVHCFPFRLSEQSIAAHSDQWREFWLNLKQGWDRFETTHVPPTWRVTDKRYEFTNIP